MKKIITCSILTTLVILFFSNLLIAGTIHSTTTGGEWNDGSTWIGGNVPEPDDTTYINGPVIVGNVENQYDIVHSYAGCVTIESNGSLQPHEYGGGLGTFILYVTHDIINNGIIHIGTLPDQYEFLQLNVGGNIVNNNAWGPQKTVLTGTDQHLTLGDGQEFGGFWETNGGIEIFANSDLVFNCKYFTHQMDVGDFNLGGSTLHMDNHSLETTGTLIYNGSIEGNFKIKGRFAVNKSNTDTLRFQGTATIVDTLENSEYGGGLGIMVLRMDGNIINNGVIRDDDDTKNADRLSLWVSGDIINNGKWSCYYVNLTGTAPQSITQSDGMFFDSFFENQNTENYIIAESDISIKEDFNLGGTGLRMQSNTLIIDGWLYNGELDNADLYGGFLQNLECTNDITMYNTVTIDDNVSFQGIIVVNDTLIPIQFGGGAKVFQVDIEGTLINNGTIKDNLWGEMLQMNISGNLTNNGDWVNYLTHIYVSNEQYIELIDDKPIEGTVEFDAVLQSETYQWYFDDNILDSEYFEGETTQVLKWLVPVSTEWYGSFSCETGTKESVGILIKQGNLGIEDGQMQDIAFEVYPNPCQEKLTLRNLKLEPERSGARRSQTRDLKLEIFDISGRLVHQEKMGRRGEGEISVDISHLPAGLYLLKLQTDDAAGVRKIIKK